MQSRSVHYLSPMIFRNARYPRLRIALLVVLALSVAFFAAIVYARFDYRSQQLVTVGLAWLGDPRAQSNVGNMYYYGQHRYIDYPAAIEWYGKAAGQGNSDAIQALVNIYLSGQGTAKDEKEALRWARIGADHELGWAQNYVGYAYENGIGTEKNYDEAVAWYRHAAEKKAMGARTNLGRMYATGQGVALDHQEAFRWFKEDADVGYSPAMVLAGIAYEKGLGTAQNYAEALKWYEAAAESLSPDAYYNIIMLHAQGRGVPRNLGAALSWAEKAKVQKMPEAGRMLTYLGTEYAKQSPPDLEKAIAVLTGAIDAGDPEAPVYLADLYLRSPTAENWQKGARMVKTALESGSAAAKEMTDTARGHCITSGQVDLSGLKTRSCFIIAEHGDPQAMFTVGESYELGLDGVRSNAETAVFWFTQAAQQNYLPAQQRLAYMNASGEKIAKNAIDAYAWYSIIGARDDLNERQRTNAEQGRVYAWGSLEAGQRTAAREKIREFTDLFTDKPKAARP